MPISLNPDTGWFGGWIFDLTYFSNPLYTQSIELTEFSPSNFHILSNGREQNTQKDPWTAPLDPIDLKGPFSNRPRGTQISQAPYILVPRKLL